MVIPMTEETVGMTGECGDEPNGYSIPSKAVLCTARVCRYD